jgi:FKBP-type peptidyl-prolyl cis-trans isomerase 2
MEGDGDIAVVGFTGRIAGGEDAGEVFDTTDATVAGETGIYQKTRDYEPLEFRVGEEEVVAGLDDAVREMAVGEGRTVEVEPARAFGERDESNVVEFPRADLEAGDDVTVEPGEIVRSESGATGWLTAVTEETVTVDFNHEHAGLPVESDVTLLDRRGDA